MVKATDISVSSMCWSICIFGAILWASSIAPIEGHQLRPNIVVVLTDDQDITLNGMVNWHDFFYFLTAHQIFSGFCLSNRLRWKKRLNCWPIRGQRLRMR